MYSNDPRYMDYDRILKVVGDSNRGQANVGFVQKCFPKCVLDFKHRKTIYVRTLQNTGKNRETMCRLYVFVIFQYTLKASDLGFEAIMTNSTFPFIPYFCSGKCEYSVYNSAVKYLNRH